MKPEVLREMSPDELELKLTELQELAFRYRFQTALGKLDNPLKLRLTRRDIARVKTILNEKIESQTTSGI